MKSDETKEGSSNQPFLTQEDLKTLKSPFAKDSLGVKVQSFSKDRARAMLVLYLQHTDVMNRLKEVDPAWTSKVLGQERSSDICYVRTRLTLKGVSRENVGEGGDPKAATSDALKRAAMLFGVGRYLYDSVTVWTEYNDARDRFKQWQVSDYERASKGRDQFNRVLMNLYRPYLSKFPETRFVELLYGRYNVGETRLMTLEQMEDLVKFMEGQLSTVESSGNSVKKESASA